MSRSNFGLLSGCFLLLSACASDVFLVHNGNMPTTDKIAELKVGQTRNEVESILGNPSMVSTLDENEWIYMSTTVKKLLFLNLKLWIVIS